MRRPIEPTRTLRGPGDDFGDPPDVVDELVGDERGGLLTVVHKEQLLDVVGDRRVAHPLEDVLVDVQLLGTRPARQRPEVPDRHRGAQRRLTSAA
jgi:hypothetical protein